MRESRIHESTNPRIREFRMAIAGFADSRIRDSRMKDKGLRIQLLRRWARMLDSAFRVPGTQFRVGIDPLIGLVPGIGDLVSPIFGVLIIWHAASLRVPKVVLARMVINAVVDGVAGAVPIVGDALDFFWRAN